MNGSPQPKLEFGMSGTGAVDWPAELQRNRPWIEKVLRSRIGDRHEVDDLFQEIALAVVRQSETPVTPSAHKGSVPSDPARVAPWLYRLAVRQAVNFHRRKNRRSAAEPTGELDPCSPAPQPLDWMLAQEQQQHLQQALESLRPQEREILTLKYTENWTYKQLAERLGVAERTIEYRLLNARKKMRQRLSSLAAQACPIATQFAANDP